MTTTRARQFLNHWIQPAGPSGVRRLLGMAVLGRLAVHPARRRGAGMPERPVA